MDRRGWIPPWTRAVVTLRGLKSPSTWTYDSVGILGTGVPRLACLRPAAWLERGPSTAHIHQHETQDPHEGPSLAGRTTQSFLRHGLVRLAHEEAERSRRGTS